MHVDFFAALAEHVRFLDVRSGQSLESLLGGPLKEVLRGVIRERMQERFDEAEAVRDDYTARLQGMLLRTLGDQVVAMGCRADLAGGAQRATDG